MSLHGNVYVKTHENNLLISAFGLKGCSNSIDSLLKAIQLANNHLSLMENNEKWHTPFFGKFFFQPDLEGVKEWALERLSHEWLLRVVIYNHRMFQLSYER